MQSIDSIETYAHGMSIDIIHKKEKIKYVSIIKQQKNNYFDYVIKQDIKEHNPKWPEIPDHPYRILIIRGSGSGKTNALLNLVNHKSDIDKIYFYAKDPSKVKYHLLINKRKSTDLKCLNYSKAFMEYLNDMDDIYKNMEGYNPNRKQKILIVF